MADSRTHPWRTDGSRGSGEVMRSEGGDEIWGGDSGERERMV